MKYINFVGTPGEVEREINIWLSQNSVEIFFQSQTLYGMSTEHYSLTVMIGIFYKLK